MLSKDKEALKNSVLNVIKKKPRVLDKQQAEDVIIKFIHKYDFSLQMDCTDKVCKQL